MMVTTIGIDPHKATHTAVVIDDDEIVLGEFTIRAGKDQTKRLIDWAGSVNGDARVWAVEADTGLGHLLSQQLIARGETVFDVLPVLASRIRVLSSGRSQKNDPNDARSVAIAALLIGYTPPIERFDTADRYAAYNGTAPIEVSSGGKVRHRLSRRGNRTLNHAIHTAAVTQIRHNTPGRIYYDKKLDEGKTTKEALRALKRRISDAIYRQLVADDQRHSN